MGGGAGAGTVGRGVGVSVGVGVMVGVGVLVGVAVGIGVRVLVGVAVAPAAKTFQVGLPPESQKPAPAAAAMPNTTAKAAAARSSVPLFMPACASSRRHNAPRHGEVNRMRAIRVSTANAPLRRAACEGVERDGGPSLSYSWSWAAVTWPCRS